jgi:hypothetical protein
MNDEVGAAWKEAVLAQSRNLSGGTEENHTKNLSLVRASAEIRTDHLPNTSAWLYLDVQYIYKHCSRSSCIYFLRNNIGVYTGRYNENHVWISKTFDYFTK